MLPGGLRGWRKLRVPRLRQGERRAQAARTGEPGGHGFLRVSVVPWVGHVGTAAPSSGRYQVCWQPACGQV